MTAMNLRSRPLYVVDLACARREPLPFEWVVEYAADGTIAGAWNQESEPHVAVLDLRLMLAILQWLDPRDRFLVACLAAMTEVTPNMSDEEWRGVIDTREADSNKLVRAYKALRKEPWSSFMLLNFVLAVAGPSFADAERARRAVAEAVPAPTVAELTATTGSR